MNPVTLQLCFAKLDGVGFTKEPLAVVVIGIVDDDRVAIQLPTREHVEALMYTLQSVADLAWPKEEK